jgi:hypothetical protein
MKDADSKISELSYLFKLLPMLHEVESVDRIYRMLLAIATGGQTFGFRRAMLFEVDAQAEAVRGRIGAEYVPDSKAEGAKTSFENMAREVFEIFESMDTSELTLRVRSFTVPFGWHRCAIVKAAQSAHPVLADGKLSEFASDPFFDFFSTERYIAVPIKAEDRVIAVVAADRDGQGEQITVQHVSMLHSLAQQASAVARYLNESSENNRKFRILWKIGNALNNAKSIQEFEEGIKLVLVMLTRVVGGSGCFLKDYTRQKTIHIKTVHEHLLDGSGNETAVAESFDEILEEAAGKMQRVRGNNKHPLLNKAASEVIVSFFAYPLMAGEDVAGALAVYVEVNQSDSGVKALDKNGRNFIELCAALIASRLEGLQREHRIKRAEAFLEEVSSHLVRERERSRIGERGIEFQHHIEGDLKRLNETLSARSAYAKRFPKIVDIAKSMQVATRAFKSEVIAKRSRFEMVDLFKLTAEVVGEWGAGVDKRGIELTVQIPARGESLLLDREKIRLALNNILKLICVADSGQGLPGDLLSRLFMPFCEASDDDERRRALSVAGEILQYHSGDVLVRSSLNWRTILLLSLPKAANKDRRRIRGDRRRRRDRRVVVKT